MGEHFPSMKSSNFYFSDKYLGSLPPKQTFLNTFLTAEILSFLDPNKVNFSVSYSKSSSYSISSILS